LGKRHGDRECEHPQWRARDKRERDKEAPDCVEDGVPFSLLFRLGGKLSGELVDALLKGNHPMHQIVRRGNAWQ